MFHKILTEATQNWNVQLEEEAITVALTLSSVRCETRVLYSTLTIFSKFKYKKLNQTRVCVFVC